METLEIAKEYYEGVEKLIGKITMILYGSTVFGVKSSDLDVCFFKKNNLSQEAFHQLETFTREFHVINNLRTDEEVPYSNKLIYTYTFIEDTLKNPPFPFYNNKYIIPHIKKDKEYLNSLEIRKRLLLNILTVKHLVIGDDKNKINEYVDKAWEIILRTVISYAEKTTVSLEEIISYLYKDPFYNFEGEMYLGYKNNMMEKIEFINEQVEIQMNRLIKEEKVLKTFSKKYIPDERWLTNEQKN